MFRAPQVHADNEQLIFVRVNDFCIFLDRQGQKAINISWLHNSNDGLFPDRQGGKAIASVAKSMNGNSIVEQVGNHAEVHETSRFTMF